MCSRLETTSPKSPPATDAIELKPATMLHVEAIFRLIDAASRTTTVLPRSKAAICERLRDFMVAVEEDEVVACGALHITTTDLAELKSVVVADRMRGRGVGRRIVEALIAEARRLGLRRLFVLTDSVDFFARMGFESTDKATLPHKVWNECILCPKFHDCQEVALDMKLQPEV